RPAWTQNTNQLAKVGAVIWLSDVLQNDAGVDETKIVVLKFRQAVLLVQQKMAAREIPVELPGEADHGGRDIHAVAGGETRGHRAGQPAHSAAKIERRASLPGRQTQSAQVLQHRGYLLAAGGKEFIPVPFVLAFLRVGADRPKGISPCEPLPVSLQLLKRFHGFPAIRRLRRSRSTEVSWRKAPNRRLSAASVASTSTEMMR